MKFTRTLVGTACRFYCLTFSHPAYAQAAPALKGRAVWAFPRDAGSEEREPLQRIRELLRGGGQAADIKKAFDGVADSLRKHSPDLHSSISEFLRNPGDPQPVARNIDAFFANVPAGYYPSEKLSRTLERVKSEGVEGIVIFSASGIASAGLWGAVGEFFRR